MIGHLGPRVSALLDGQLSPVDEERAWEHVHSCHTCRDQVEREGWVKTRLAVLTFADADAPSRLKGHLKGRLAVPAGAVAYGGPWAAGEVPPGDALISLSRLRRGPSLGTIGGGALGAAVMGVLALGAAPANAPSVVQRPPATSLTGVSHGSGQATSSREGVRGVPVSLSTRRTLRP